MLDLERQSLGPVRLGDALEAARPLGKPVRVRRRGGGTTLEYAQFDLEFLADRLVCVKFDIDEGSQVHIGDLCLRRGAKPIDALVWFGEPASDSSGGDGLRWIDFERSGATLALEFDAGGLRCVQLYAAGYA